MRTVDKAEFDEFLANTATRSEPDAETDGEYAYETWTDHDGAEVALATYRGGEPLSYQIADA